MVNTTEPLRREAIVPIHNKLTLGDCSVSTSRAAGGHALQRAQALGLWLLTIGIVYLSFPHHQWRFTLAIRCNIYVTLVIAPPFTRGQEIGMTATRG